MNCYVIEKGGQNVFLFTFCFLSVEDTKLSTNKQNSLSNVYVVGRPAQNNLKHTIENVLVWNPIRRWEFFAASS